MLTNNYFCTLKYKIMKGILPVYCRTMGYVVLLLSVFVPLFMFMFGMINDSNLLFTKASIKLLILDGEELFSLPVADGKGDGYFALRLWQNHVRFADFQVANIDNLK